MPDLRCPCGGEIRIRDVATTEKDEHGFRIYAPMGVCDDCGTVFSQPALDGRDRRIAELERECEAASEEIRWCREEDRLRYEMEYEHPDSQEALDAWADAKIHRDMAREAYDAAKEGRT